MKLLDYCKHLLTPQILKAMRLTFFFLTAAFLQLSAKGVAQTVTYSGKNVKLEKVFTEIKKQTGFVFFYSSQDIKFSRQVTITFNNTPVEESIKQIMANQPLTYIIKGNTVFIKAKSPATPAVQSGVSPQKPPPPTFPVTGSVVDERGQPVVGASVVVVNTNTGATTDKDGRFHVVVNSPGDSIIVSYIGYHSQTVRAFEGKPVSLTLIPNDQNDMANVVVIAYGQRQKKIATLGAQSTLSVTELKQPVANISTVLAGRVSGLVGVQRSGEPGRDAANIWIRGIATMSNSSPLILVDGVERAFNNIDPNDIESFTILKDASSTSVFGVRGANGVILITTKKGRVGRTDINIDYYEGRTQFTKLPQTADGVTYMQMANEASVTRGGNPIYTEEQIRKTGTQEDPYLYPNMNWVKEIFNDFGGNRKANLSIRGGTDKVNFYVSAGYYDETGLFKVDKLQQYNSTIKFTRYNFSSAISIKTTKTMTVDLGIKGWISNGNYPGTSTGEIFREMFDVYPIIYPKMYPDNKEPFISTGGGLNSPYALLTNRGYSTVFENQIMSDLHVKQDLGMLVKGLSARVLYSFDATNSNTLNRVKTPTVYYATGRDAQGNLVLQQQGGAGQDYLTFSRTNGGSRQFYLEAAINYARKFNKHDVGAMILYNQSDRVSGTATDLINSIPFRSLGMVGRLTYSYDDRYLAEGTFGYNGAETFAPGSRFGFFPSAAVGWVVSNENFYGNLENVIQLLKVRASYGIVGNSRIEGRRFAYVGTTSNTNTYYYGQDRGNGIVGIDIADYPVTATWETEKDLNLGLEFKTLNNALYIQADVFNRRRENIFLNRGVVPDFLGIRNNLLGNLGIVNSRGIDLSADYNKRLGKVNVMVRGTFTYNENERIEDDSPSKPYPWLETRGLPVYYRMGYVAEGFYTQKEIDNPAVPRTTGVVMAGDLKFKDLNGDGKIDGNDARAIGRDQVPQILYGFGTQLSYKNFSVSAFFQGTGLVDFYFANDFMPFRNGMARGSLYSNILDRWTPENPNQNAFYPRLSYGADINQNYATNSHFVMNGRFLRLKTLDFGYTFNKGALSKYGVQNMRVYFIGYNLITWTPFKFWDPELGGGAAIDGGAGTRYPNIKTFSLGLNVTF